MLAGAGFSDNALLAHPSRQENLAEGIVDLMGARVQKVLTLEINFRATEVAC